MEKYRFTEPEKSLIEGLEIPFAVYQFIDSRVVTIALSKGFCALFGYDDPAKAYHDMDHDMYKDTHEDDISRISDAAVRFATEGGSYDVIYRTKSRDGNGYNIIHAFGKHVYTKEGVRLAQISYTDEGSYTEGSNTSDTMIARSLKNALYEQSFLKANYYDNLTALPGMTYFFELATARRAEIWDQGDTPALLFTDFSGMKYYNHKYGFAEGDQLLQSFAKLLTRFFGNDNCSRLGQDHFAVITKCEGLEEQLSSLIEECRGINDGRTLPLHIGIYEHWFDGIVASMACDRAKIACDAISNEYSSGYNYYDMSMKDLEEKQQYIIANLDKAIAERWIKVYYQPIVRAVSIRVCDEEALARWIDPVKGFMSPADFIPVLEDHRLIYKLDLYVVECVLQKIKTLRSAGLHIMPQSVNLSRSDFDCCDIVEEIRRRVDDFGISHDLLTIEITESMIGSDFEFMKKQIDRFREYGFAVWMDDFGSGYSSLDVLQSVKFDLIKFDMRFMQQFDKSDKGKIILTELLRMANSLGLDTVCEGVETEEQVKFLQETGCSKLQGYYFEKPVPVERILEKYAKGIQIGFEDPAESKYYDDIGRVNLHDLSVIAKGDADSFESFFNTLPIAILEISNGQFRFSRTNQSYRDFMNRYFALTINEKPEKYHSNPNVGESLFMKALLQSCTDSGNIFIDEYFPGNTVVHSCIRRIAINPVSGNVATAAVVLSISDGDRGTTYASIARALAADYFNLYYVDLETDSFIEYSSEAENDTLAVERHGEDFFNASQNDALKYIFSEDIEAFVRSFTKENVIRALDERGAYTQTYRLLMKGEPIYVSMKAMRMQHDPRHMIIGVSSIDSQMKQKRIMEMFRVNRLAYTRLMALAGDFMCIYTVDLDTGDYVEYSAAESYRDIGLAREGRDFFVQAGKDGRDLIYEEDLAGFIETFTRENVLNEIRRSGTFRTRYRLMISGRIIPVYLKAVIVPEEEGEKLMVGVFKEENGSSAE